MKKSYVLIGLFLLFVVIIAIVGSVILSGNIKIEENDVLMVQRDRETYLDCYGYTIDNPNVVANPYGNSPLTALVMFETDYDTDITVVIKGKNGNEDISYSLPTGRVHMVPIFGLYADYDNVVIIKAKEQEKEIHIKTEKLPDDFDRFSSETRDNFVFYNVNYPYAIDSSGEVRWFLNKKYLGNITYIGDSKIVIGSDKYIEDNKVVSCYLMNLLGKIYSEYLLTDGYRGSNAASDENLILMSDNVLVIDRQTGSTREEIVLNDNYNYVGILDNDVIVGNDDGFYRAHNKFEKVDDYTLGINKYNIFSDVSYYKIVSARRYGLLDETKVSEKKISLLGYKAKNKLDDIYVMTVDDRIVITNNSDDNVYIIFDKFLDKRVYEVSDVMYINKTGFKGKYTIYYMLHNKVYKTNYYIEV